MKVAEAGRVAKPLRADWLLPLAGVALAVAAWTVFTWDGAGRGGIMTSFSPRQAFPALVELLVEPRTWAHVAASLKRIVVGLALAFGVGVPVGLAVGSIGWLDRASAVVIQFIRMISPLSWMPIAVMALGIGDAPVYFLLFVAAVWPLALNTAAGVKACDVRWVEMAKSLGANPAEVVRHVVIPAVAKHVLTGFRLSLGVAWIVLVPAEMLGVRAGLGYAILDARDRMAYPELMATILLIGLLGWVMDALTRKFEARPLGV